MLHQLTALAADCWCQLMTMRSDKLSSCPRILLWVLLRVGYEADGGQVIWLMMQSAGVSMR